MKHLLFRASSVGKLMAESKSKAEGILSKGAKTYVRMLVAQEIYGVEFTVSTKQMKKGTLCELDSIALLNEVRGLSLVKNTERKSDGFLTGECDLFDAPAKRGHDLKTSWSIATFPITPEACVDSDYEWQCRVYMALWGADRWEVNYALVDTPQHLIGFEPIDLHIVSHFPAHHRLTTWCIERDEAKELLIYQKVKAAREYAMEVIAEFDRTHPETILEAA